MTTTLQTTNKAPALPAKPSALNLMAARLSVDPAKLLDTLKATVFKGANNEELLALVTVANEYGLNPFLKEIYAFPSKGGGIVPIVSVDGWNKMLIRQPDFDGIEFSFTDKEDGDPHACTATVHVKNRTHPMKITEYFDECRRNTDPWNNMPRRMLRNRTLCQASRMAFGFSGIYHEDEAATITIESTVMPSEPPPKLVALPAGDGQGASANSGDLHTVQQTLSEVITGAGYTFSHFQKWAVESGNVPEADSLASFDEVPTNHCKRLLRAQAGLLKGLQMVKEQEGGAK
jgi:phage recombination protein Bet